MKELEFPRNNELLIKNKRKIKKELLTKEGLVEKKIAVLGGSTTNDVLNILELFLLDSGIKPIFYESDYNSFFTDSVFDNPKLDEFNPDLIYIYTTNRNILLYPSVNMTKDEIDNLLNEEYSKYQMVWDNLIKKYHVPIIQNNFELPLYRIMGNMDLWDIHGRVNYINKLNEKFNEYARNHKNFYLNDINYISSCYGLDRWYNEKLWYMYKYATDILAIPDITFSVASIIKAIYGKNKKAFVLDMDNTLWGGVIGDDGVEGIKIGNDTAQGQAYLAFQKYIKEHKDYGIILNVSSKNDYENALLGLNHPDSVLKKEDFVSIKANWDPKSINIANLASELSLGSDSFLFVDDNPAEREIVSQSFKNIGCPNISQVEEYIRELDKNRYFEIISISSEDTKKTEMYKSNMERQKLMESVTNYDDYLTSLSMVATIKPFEKVYLERITQLAGKSNQFNLTTRRYTLSEIEDIYNSKDYITLYGRLEDKFGDNGLVSVVIGKIKKDVLDIDLWIMSCRVLKRDLENAMMNTLVKKAKEKGIKKIVGYYYKTEKNSMVKDFYKNFAFKLINEKNEDTIWELDVSKYQDKKALMQIND